MDESNLGFFSRLYYSITSFDKYRYFLRQSTSKAVVYLLLITMFIAVIVSVQAGIQSGKIIDDIITGISGKIPDFQLADGKLEVNGKMPIIIDDGTTPIIIDTSPNVDEKILDGYDSAILITSDKIISKSYVNKSVTDLSQFKGMVINRQMIQQSLPLIKPFVNIAIVFVGIFIVCGKFITALIVSLFGMIINSARNTRLTYRSIFKISVYSMTLPLILGAVLDLALPQFLFKWLLFYIISFVYVFGAINSIKREIDSADFNNMTDPGNTNGMG